MKFKGWDPQSDEAEEGAPRTGVYTWIIGTAFVLREVELSTLTVDSSCIVLDDRKRTCMFKLPVSKTDPAGRGASHALGCSCSDGARNILCPFHAVRDVLTSILAELDLDHISQLENEGVPLIGRRDCLRQFVEKRHFVLEAQRHVRMACAELESVDIDSSNITGHFMRRSGIKELARKGSTFATIQWFARHSSNVTWGYIEESWGECPEHSLKLRDEMALTDALATTLAKVNSLEEALSNQSDLIEQSLERDGIYVIDEAMRVQIREEARKAVLPKFIINVSTRTIHVPSQSMCFKEDPKYWVTGCGWRWVSSDGCCRPVYDEGDWADDIKECRKCFG